MALDRDQVLHVARLARLELSEEEIDKFVGELGDLADVPPTSHVIDVENALRADEPRPSLPPEVALGQAPDVDRGGFRVPSPGPAPA